MKTLSERVSKRDDYSVYGEHVGNRLRSCGRNNFEISIAQHHIDGILFDLTMGVYGRHPHSGACGTHKVRSHSPLTVATGHQNYRYSYPSSSSSSPSPPTPSFHQSNSVPPSSTDLPSADTPLHSQSAQDCIVLTDRQCV
jgi:hypothetical protein